MGVDCKSSTVFAVDDDVTIAKEEIIFAYTVFKVYSIILQLKQHLISNIPISLASLNS